jgi:hypothetical protein
MSVEQLKKFLEDAQGLPDTTTVKIGDAEVPLGSIRALNRSEREQLAAGLKANDDRKKELEKQQGIVVDLAKQAQAAYDAAREAQAKAGQPVQNNSNSDPFNDPWLQPVRKELDNRDKKIEELTGQLRQMATIVQNAAGIWSEDRWDREYDRIDQGKREKKLTRQELLDYATQNNLLDRHKLPSLRLAWEKMSQADRETEMRKDEFEKGREAGRLESLAARVPPPGVPGPGAPPASPRPAPGELGDLYAEAIKDPELRQLIEQLPAGMM